MITLANPSSQVSFMHELQAPSMDKISWIQRDTVSHSLIRKIFLGPPFSSPRRPFFRYPWVGKRAEKTCGNSYTPVPARPRRFSATPGPLVRCQDGGACIPAPRSRHPSPRAQAVTESPRAAVRPIASLRAAIDPAQPLDIPAELPENDAVKTQYTRKALQNQGK